MPVTTFRPDAHPETSSVDGHTRRAQVTESWSVLRAGTGTTAWDDTATDVVRFRAKQVPDTDLWSDLNRGFLLFDISSLSPEDVFLSTTIRLAGQSKFNTLGGLPSIVIVSSNPASNTALVTADQTTLGTEALSNVILYDDYLGNDWNEFTLNQAGKDVLTAAVAGDGIARFGVRESTYDRLGIPPPWGALNQVIMEWIAADNGVTFAPQLVISHGEPGHYWVESTAWHFIDEFSAERTFTGIQMGGTGEAGHYWVEGIYWHWIDEGGNERRALGTKLGATGKEVGHFFVRGTRWHYIDGSGDERFLPFEEIFNGSVYNQLLFNG